MADNENPVAISFTDQYLRPLAEAVRNLTIRAEDAKTEWLTSVGPIWAPHSPGEKLLDGSPEDGRTTVDKQDHDDLIALFATLLAAMGTTSAKNMLSKFTVRPPRLGE